MWIRLDANYVMLGVGNVYDVDSIILAFYESMPKRTAFLAVRAMPVACQFTIPYKLYNGTQSHRSVFRIPSARTMYWLAARLSG